MQTTEPSQREFFNLALPNILSNLAVPLSGLIDTALLGHLPEIDPLAGVALGATIFSFLYWGFGFLRVGTTALTAQALGAEKPQEQGLVLKRALSLALLIAGVMLLLQSLISAFGFWVLQGSESVEAEGALYFQARIWAAPATLGLYVLNGWLLGNQKATHVMVLAILLNTMNIIMDVLFIYHWQMGAWGAGIATTLATLTTFLVGLIIVWKHYRTLPSSSDSLFEKEGFTSLLKLNANLMVRTLCLITAMTSFTNISASFSTTWLAANTILMQLLATSAYFIDGYAYAIEALVGKFFGAKKHVSVRRSFYMGLGWNLATVTLICLLILFQGRYFLGLINSHQEVVELANDFRFYVCITLLFSGFSYIFDGLFFGLAQGRVLRNSMIFALLIGYLPLAIPAYYQQLPWLLWPAMVTFMAIRTLALGKAIPKLESFQQ